MSQNRTFPVSLSSQWNVTLDPSLALKDVGCTKNAVASSRLKLTTINNAVAQNMYVHVSSYNYNIIMLTRVTSNNYTCV